MSGSTGSSNTAPTNASSSNRSRSNNNNAESELAICRHVILSLMCFPVVCVAALTTCIFCSAAAAGSAAVNSHKGKRWDAKRRMYIIDNIDRDKEYIYFIPEDDSDILPPQDNIHDDDDENSESTAKKEGVKETRYYALLGVQVDAEESTIKRAYYMKARKYHPDKNPDSEEAKEMFQKISEAYQVLSDPTLRKQYDKEGEAGLSGDKTSVRIKNIRTDPSLLFTMLFGSESFFPIIGRLSMATAALMGETVVMTDLNELERRRIIRLSLNLLKRINNYLDAAEADCFGNTFSGDASPSSSVSASSLEGEEESESDEVKKKKEPRKVDDETNSGITRTSALKQKWIDEAKKLANDCKYGEEILNLVGKLYKIFVEQVIGGWKDGVDAKMDETKLRVDASMKAIEGARKLNYESGKYGKGGKREDLLPTVWETMWSVTSMDITSTIREVVFKLLYDNSKPKLLRKQRGEVIKIIGTIYEEAKRSNQTT